jgi:3-hydroxybutyryl-CoA dehydrogenase
MTSQSLCVAIIGAGAAGRSFAAACSAAGHRVVLEDVMPAKLRRAEEVFASLGHRVELVLTVEDAVRNADIAVDFVPDELESKLEIFSLLDRMAPPRTILCTPSDGLSITDLASCTYRAERCVMLRGLPPGAHRFLVPAAATESTTSLVGGFLHSLGSSAEAELDPDLPMLMKNMGLAGTTLR